MKKFSFVFIFCLILLCASVYCTATEPALLDTELEPVGHFLKYLIKTCVNSIQCNEIRMFKNWFFGGWEREKRI